MQRRAASIFLLGSAALPGTRIARAQQSEPSAPYSDPEAAERWLQPLLSSPGAVAGSLHLGRFADRTYFTLKPIFWTPNPGQAGLPAIKVPEGFVTDLASIPRILWSLLPTDGLYTFPAIVHDYLYWTQSTSREQADTILKYGMEDMKVASTTVATVHLAVRLGGLGPWDENAALRKQGERRILVEYPEDPKITWADWKARPAVLR